MSKKFQFYLHMNDKIRNNSTRENVNILWTKLTSRQSRFADASGVFREHEQDEKFQARVTAVAEAPAQLAPGLAISSTLDTELGG